MEYKYEGNSLKSGIYKITNKLNGRIYIGSAKRFKERWQSHTYSLRNQKHKNKFLQNDFNKCGEDAFIFEVIEVITDVNKRKDLEQEYITSHFDKQKQCYNIMSTVAPDPATFSKTPEETRAKRVTSQLGSKRTEETKRRMSESQKGRVVSQETRKKIGDASRGRITSEETKKKISAAGKGRIVSAETRQKTSQSNRAAKTRNSYLLRSPTGEEVYVENIQDWCIEQGFPPKCMYKMLSGKYPKKHITCHGYSLIKLMPENLK